MAVFGPESFVGKSGRVFEIRNCDPSWADLFIPFQETIAAETTHTLMVVGRPPSVERVQGMWREWLDQPVNLALAVLDDRGQMVGHAILMPSRSDDHPWTRHVGRFAMMLVREVWGEGLGKTLLMILENHAKKTGIHRIEAEVRVKNERGVRLYLNAGFKIEGTRERAAWIDGQFEDEYTIAKWVE
jgi:RimJ/RimL family protein N-acetyltransferase